MSAALAAGAVAGAIPDKAKSFVTIAVTLLVIGIVIFIILKVSKGITGIGEMFGFTRDEKEKELDKAAEIAREEAQNYGSPWSPQYYKAAQKDHDITLITSAFADQLADEIWNSVGTFYDTPTKATAAIKRCPTKAAVSFLSERFNARHNRDLYNWLDFKFDTDEQKQQLTDMVQYVRSLPPYKI